MKLAILLVAMTLQAQTFEVASVRPNKSDEHIDYGAYADHLIGKNMSLHGWIQIAYQLKDFQVITPGWASNERFDIRAKAPGPVTFTQMMVMLQALLADRCQLKVHRETRQSTVYSLVTARGGIKMRLSKDQTLFAGDYPNGSPDGRPLKGGSPRDIAPGHIAGDDVPLTILVNLLAGPLGRIVVNNTGSKARYDFDLRYNPDPTAQSPDPDIFTAVQEQLGLKLESAKAPVETLIVDHLVRPSEN